MVTGPSWTGYHLGNPPLLAGAFADAFGFSMPRLYGHFDQPAKPSATTDETRRRPRRQYPGA